MAELLQEIDETPNNSHKPLKPKAITNFSPLSVRQAERVYMNKLASSVKKPTPSLTKQTTKILIENNKIPPVLRPINPAAKEPSPEENKESCLESQVENIEVNSETEPAEDECFNDDLDMSQISEPVLQTEEKGDKDNIWEGIEEEMLKEWTAVEETNETETIDLKNSDVPLVDVNDKKVFRFFWWDAFEDSLKQPGVVFLFGKTYHEQTKTYASCCVAVRNIERRLFFLPRATVSIGVTTKQCVFLLT